MPSHSGGSGSVACVKPFDDTLKQTGMTPSVLLVPTARRQQPAPKGHPYTLVESNQGFGVEADVLASLHKAFSEADFLRTGFFGFHVPLGVVLRSFCGRESSGGTESCL